MSLELMTDEPWFAHLPVPRADGHKHDRGHALVLAGPRHATGAARLSADAALRAGAGLVTVAASPQAADIVATHVTAIMVHRTGPDALAGALREVAPTAVLLGPGLPPDARAREAVAAALASGVPCVLDAGALTAFADDPETLLEPMRERDAATVLTPHGGEFGRVFADASPLEAAARSGAVVVLKGPDTLVAAPDGRSCTVTQGPPWLATAGTGDVLAGIVSGLLAQSMPAFEAACAAVRVHAEAALALGPAMTADDLDAGLRAVLGPLLRSRMGLDGA